MEAKKASPNWNAKREFVGEYLFTLQEFYSNTNWVEMFRNQSCKELGKSYSLVWCFFKRRILFKVS